MDMNMDIDSISDALTSFWKRIRRLQFGTKAQLAFLEDLYTLINDGIPANKAIEMMVQVNRGIRREVAAAIEEKISEGLTLADGMREWFSISVVEIIRVGEAGGVLAETMKSAISSLTQRSGAIGALIAAIAYPLMVISMACFVIVYLNNTVLTQFKTFKPYAEWPEAGQELASLANLIQSWWWLVILIVFAVIFVFRKILTNYVGELRPFLDRYPPFSLYRRFVAARFMETLGLLVANGVVFKNALKVMQYQADPYLASHLVLMEHLLSMGKGNIADVLATGLVDDADVTRLRVMGEVKGFEHGLIRLGIRGAEQSTSTMKLISKVVGATLLVVGAYLIVTVIRGIYLTGMSLGGI